MKVKLAPGITIVRDPRSRLPIADVAEVPDDNYWRRRLIAGDVVIVDEPPMSAPVAPLTTRGGK